MSRSRAGAPASLGRGGCVRRARSLDLERVVELWSGLAAHHAALDAAFALRPGVARGAQSFLRRVLEDGESRMFVWESEARIEGLCIVRIERAPPLLVEEARAEITELGVEPGQRRQGIGRALAEVALAWVAERGVRRVEARVAAANAEGQTFWRRLGFGDFVDVLDRRL